MLNFRRNYSKVSAPRQRMGQGSRICYTGSNMEARLTPGGGERKRGAPAEMLHTRQTDNRERIVNQQQRNQAHEEKRDFEIAEQAKAEIHKDLANFDIDVYRRTLEKKIARLEDEESEHADGSPELHELNFLRAKRTALNAELAVPAGTAHGNEGTLSQRLRVERERLTVKREMTKNNNQIARLTETRDKLNLWNPWHWGRIINTNDQLTALNHRSEDLANRSKMVTAFSHSRE